jgi:hypothetical protein
MQKYHFDPNTETENGRTVAENLPAFQIGWN